MKFIISAITAVFATALQVSEQDMEFLKYVSQYGKSYETQEEFMFRAQVFADNLSKIKNIKETTSTHGVNKFTDRTTAEMKLLLGYKA